MEVAQNSLWFSCQLWITQTQKQKRSKNVFRRLGIPQECFKCVSNSFQLFFLISNALRSFWICAKLSKWLLNLLKCFNTNRMLCERLDFTSNQFKLSTKCLFLIYSCNLKLVRTGFQKNALDEEEHNLKECHCLKASTSKISKCKQPRDKPRFYAKLSN